LIDLLYIVLRPAQESFTYMETLPFNTGEGLQNLLIFFYAPSFRYRVNASSPSEFLKCIILYVHHLKSKKKTKQKKPLQFVRIRQCPGVSPYGPQPRLWLLLRPSTRYEIPRSATIKWSGTLLYFNDVLRTHVWCCYTSLSWEVSDFYSYDFYEVM
jgi:hypothetical protein